MREVALRAPASPLLSPCGLRVNCMRYVKYALAAVASVLWLIGLADQLPDLTQTAKYLGISMLMVAVAKI